MIFIIVPMYRTMAGLVGKNAKRSGTTGYEKRMEALQIAVVPKGSAAPGSTSNVYKEKAVTGGVGYETHMQTYGWRAMTLNGATGGVVGESKRMEAHGRSSVPAVQRRCRIQILCTEQRLAWLGEKRYNERNFWTGTPHGGGSDPFNRRDGKEI